MILILKIQLANLLVHYLISTKAVLDAMSQQHNNNDAIIIIFIIIIIIKYYYQL